MPSLDDYAGIKPEEIPAQETQEETTVRRGFALPEWLKAKSSREPLETFIDHPLNFAQDPDLGRAVRGLTSMFDALDYAVIDVIVGLLKFARKKKPVDVTPQPPQGWQV